MCDESIDEDNNDYNAKRLHFSSGSKTPLARAGILIVPTGVTSAQALIAAGKCLVTNPAQPAPVLEVAGQGYFG
jgi:hypothetical protein